MSKYTHIALQALAMLVQVGNLTTSVVPPKYQGLVTALLSVGQAVLAIYNHGASNGKSS